MTAWIVTDANQIARAAALAAELHAGQVRKGTDTPYLTHPAAVAQLVARAGGDTDEICAAWLHDTVEDCGGAPVLERIAREFVGTRVAPLVAACTQTDVGGWQETRAAYLRKLERENASVQLIACADKLHNASCIVRDLRRDGVKTLERFARPDLVFWYYSELDRVLCRTPCLGFNLSETVNELHYLTQP